MRLKRLARLGGPAPTVQSTQSPAADQASESQQPQPGPSASSRLLNTSTPTQSNSSPQPSSAPKASTSTPVARPIKRSTPAAARPEPTPAPAIRKPPPPARLPVPYPEWEAQKIQGIFSVTLSVSFLSRYQLTAARRCPKERLDIVLAQGIERRDRVGGWW
jgi:hypothetical protein